MNVAINFYGCDEISIVNGL